MYKCKNFNIYELVCKDTYEKRGERAWQLIDPQMLRLIDYLRDRFGKVTINDWHWGGNFESRGLRIATDDDYRPYSQHTFGRATDLIFNDVTAEEVRKWIKLNIDLIYEDLGIKSVTVEEGVSWLHIDLRNNTDGYNSFYP